MRRALPLLLLAALACGAPRVAGPAARAAARAEVGATLDALHAAASRADGDGYFALFDPEAVFLGTDASERWSVEEFRAYAQPYFSAGRGWTYLPRERHVDLAADLRTAWFDERLESESYGECRGTGVLVRRGGAWRIAQYNLTLPVPNELARDLVERIRGLAADG